MTSTLHRPTLAIPDGSPGIEREIVEPRRRTLAVTTFATLVALAAFTGLCAASAIIAALCPPHANALGWVKP